MVQTHLPERSASTPTLHSTTSGKSAQTRGVGGKKHRRIRGGATADVDDGTEDDIVGSAANKLRQIVNSPWNFRLHRVSVPRSCEDGRTLPLQAPSGLSSFRNLGDFVRFHRSQRAADSGKLPKFTKGDLPPEEAFETEMEEDEGEDEPETEEAFEARVQDLHTAAVENDASRVRLLLSGSGSRRCLPSPDLSLACETYSFPETAALKAAREGCTASCIALLDARADPLVRDGSRRFFADAIWPHERNPDKHGSATPADRLDTDALTGRSLIYWLRLRKKFDAVIANVFPMTRVSIVRSIVSGLQEHYGESALVVAARQGAVDLTALLVTHAAMGLPPLVNSHGQKGAGSTLSTTCWGSGWGTTGERGFAAAGRSTSSSWTSASTASGQKNIERAEALTVACSRKEWRVALILLGAGVPAASMGSSKDHLGRTALHIAAAAGAADVVTALLAARHHLKLTSCRGRLPIHEACDAGHVKVVTALLEGRADPMAVTEEDLPTQPKVPGRRGSIRNQTGLDLARTAGHGEVCALLVRHCSDRPSSEPSSRLVTPAR